MARRPARPNLAAVDLKDAGTPQTPEAERNSKAQTLRLPPKYWRYVKIKAALRDTSQIAIVQQALDDLMARDPLPPGVQ